MRQQLLSSRRVAHPVDKRLGDLDVHVGFQEGQPDVAECRVDIGLGEHPAAGQTGDNLLKFTLQRLEHSLTRKAVEKLESWKVGKLKRYFVDSLTLQLFNSSTSLMAS